MESLLGNVGRYRSNSLAMLLGVASLSSLFLPTTARADFFYSAPNQPFIVLLPPPILTCTTPPSSNAVDVSGLVNTLQNDTPISATGTAITVHVGAQVGVISNRCSTNGPIGLKNLAAITSLYNSGILGGGIGQQYTANPGSTWQGIQNAAHIGTIINSGSIFGDDAIALNGPQTGHAIVNLAGASIGSLTNSGTVWSSSNNAIMNSGSWSSINNNGLIAGLHASVDNIGSIDNIINRPNGQMSGNYIVLNEAYGNIGTIINSGTVVFGISFLNNYGTIHQFVNNFPIYNYSSESGNTINNFGNIDNIEINSLISGARSTMIGNSIPTGSVLYNTGILGSIKINSTGDLDAPYSIAINNAGGIDSIQNDGRIAGYSGAIVNTGYIGSITSSSFIGTNSREIPTQVIGVSSDTVITNFGYIEKITNTISGQITGLTVIFNAGIISQIDNSGVIGGDIINKSSNTLSINGSTGNTFGVLTGYQNPGYDRTDATITSTNADVIFSGNLLLDDALALGAHTLVSTGNLQINRALKLSGNFQQSGGSLIVGVNSATSYGQINVTGTASLSSALITIKPLVSNILFLGETFTVVQSTGALSTSNLSASAPGYSATLSNAVVGGQNDLIITLNMAGPSMAGPSVAGPSVAGPSTDTPPAASYARLGALVSHIAASSSPSAAAFQSTVLPALAALPAASQAKAIAQLAPLPLGAQTGVSVSAPAMQAVGAHQDNFAGAMARREYASLNSDDYYGYLAPHGRGLWGKLVGGAATRSDGPTSAFDASLFGLVFGADIYRSDTVLAGAAVSWLDGQLDGRQSLAGSATHLSSYQLTGYATADAGHRITVDGQASFALNRYDQSRRLDFLNTSAKSNYDGHQYGLSGTISYALPIPGTVRVSPFVGLRAAWLENGGYSESGAAAADLRVDSLSTNSLTQETGIKFDSAIDTPAGRLKPTLRVAWAHEYTNGPISISGTLAGEAFASANARPSADGALIGLASVLERSARMKVALEYEGDLRKGFQNHTAALKATWAY